MYLCSEDPVLLTFADLRMFQERHAFDAALGPKPPSDKTMHCLKRSLLLFCIVEELVCIGFAINTVTKIARQLLDPIDKFS